LKGSSDDGISSLKLLFRDEKSGGIETRVSTHRFLYILSPAIEAQAKQCRTFPHP